jgi:phosphoheptose isomerase
MTPLRMRYDESYAQAFPFNKMVEGMMNPEMIADTVEIIRNAVKDGVQVNVIINNRTGGNAPLIARELVNLYLKGGSFPA